MSVSRTLDKIERDTARASGLLDSATSRLEQLLQDAGVTVSAPPVTTGRAWSTSQRAHWRCGNCDTHWSGVGSICPICHARDSHPAIEQPPREYAVAWYRDD